MTEAMPFLQKCDITFLRPPPFSHGVFFFAVYSAAATAMEVMWVLGPSYQYR